MITVHHLNNSRSQRILWLLEELQIPYQIKFYERDPKTMMAPASLREIHPLGKSPVLTDDQTTVAESGAIIEYILEKYAAGQLVPAVGSEDFRKYKYWLHYAEGSAMPPLLLSLIFSKVESAPVPFFVKPVIKEVAAQVKKAFIQPQMKLHIGFMERELEKHTWFAGNSFSAADIQMSFPVEAAEARGFLEQAPRLKSYLEKIRSRPAYQKALEKGGPFNLLT